MNSELDRPGISSVDASQARRAVNNSQARAPQKLRKPERDEPELADLVELYVEENVNILYP
jgi:hypothetical protein